MGESPADRVRAAPTKWSYTLVMVLPLMSVTGARGLVRSQWRFMYTRFCLRERPAAGLLSKIAGFRAMNSANVSMMDVPGVSPNR